MRERERESNCGISSAHGLMCTGPELFVVSISRELLVYTDMEHKRKEQGKVLTQKGYRIDGKVKEKFVC